MMTQSMWGNIEEYESIQPPHEIIAKQNGFLKEMTKGLLELKIERKQSTTIYNYDIFISAPTINQKQRIFRLTHDIKIYPANIYDEQGTKEYKSADQAEFEINLGKILSSKETMTTIAGMLAQARLDQSNILV